MNEYGRHFEFYITLDETDRFSIGSIEYSTPQHDHCRRFLENDEFDPAWNLRYLQDFRINTAHDLDKLNDIHPIPIDPLRDLLDDSTRILFPDIMFIIPVFDKDKIRPYIKPFDGRRNKSEISIFKNAQIDSPRVYCVLVVKNKFYSDTVGLNFLRDHIRQDIGEYQLFIPKTESIPQDIPKYRLYLNDRLLTERIYETSLEHDRRCYAESIWIKNKPSDGFNFTLATDLNLTIAAVDIDGVRHRVNAKTFTYTPDK